MKGRVDVQIKTNRLLGLDVLRFIAITLVIFHHLLLNNQDTFSYSFLNTALRGGWTGVDLFFVLSGFLVSGLLFTEFKAQGKVRLGRFLLRRAWRIYPPFWVMIFFSVLLYDFHFWDRFYLHGFLGEMTFLQNYIGGLWGPTWSLAVEEHFYLLLTLIFFLLLNLNKNSQTLFRTTPWIFLCVAVICLAARYVYANKHGISGAIDLIHKSHFRVDSLMFGVLLSYWWHMKATERHKQWLTRNGGKMVVGGAMCFLPAFVWNAPSILFIPVFGVILFYIGGGAMVLGAISRSTFTGRFWTLLANLGRHSYSVYLWNGIVYEVFVTAIRTQAGVRWSNYLEFITVFTLSWLVGILAAKTFETPFLKLRERYVP